MGEIAIHKFFRGRYHPHFGGKATNYLVVSGPNPLGELGGRNGEYVDGDVRKHYRTSPSFQFRAAEAAAINFAVQLAVDEGLEFIGDISCNTTFSNENTSLDLNTQIPDSRMRRLINTVIRPDQANFRLNLIDAYDGKCCMSGVSVSEALQAAHIRPYLGHAAMGVE